MDSKEYLTNKKFCPIPWSGFMYNSNGDVLNCIRSQRPIGNLKDNSIYHILKTNTETKQNMLDHKDEKIGSFSGGMKQRIGIAQILMHPIGSFE